jgi:Ca2+/Na+ antiporter
MKIIDDLFEIIKFLIIIIVVVGIVLFVELKIISNFDSVWIQFLIRFIIVFLFYQINKLWKSNFVIIGILFYISITTYILLFSDSKENKKNDTNIIIKQKSVFQSEEQKHKYNYGTIEEKINILKNMGFSKQEIYKKLENNTEFRILIKDNQNKFENIYDGK